MIRKHLMLLGAVLALVACTPTEDDAKWTKGQKVTLTTSIEESTNGSQKVAPKDITTSGAVKLYWQDGDDIKVTVGNSSETFHISKGVGTQVAEFEGVFPAAGSTYVVEYPAVSASKQNQTYVEKSFDRNLLCMRGQSSTTTIQLAAIDGVISFFIKGTYTLGKIELKDINTNATYTLDCSNGGEGVQLNTTEPTPFSFVLPAGALSNGYTVSIYNTGNTLVDTRTRNNGGNTITASKVWRVTINPRTAGPKVVDLGLSVDWSATNLGGTTPTDYGKYYAWADINGYTPAEDNHAFTWTNYPHSNNGSGNDFTKYNANDLIAAMHAADDAAAQEFGGSWRIPTIEEWKELLDHCTYTVVTDYQGSGVNGLLFTRDGYEDELFLPAAGYYNDNSNPAAPLGLNKVLNYWAADLAIMSETGARNFHTEATPGYTDPRTIFFGGYYTSLWYTTRCFGLSVRPVATKL